MICLIVLLLNFSFQPFSKIPIMWDNFCITYVITDLVPMNNGSLPIVKNTEIIYLNYNLDMTSQVKFIDSTFFYTKT